MKKQKVTFSMIIPCYNSPIRFINRLLTSLTKQGIEKDQLQVILVDDQSTEKEYLETAKTFEDKLNIEYVTTEGDYHTPANTRECGLPYVKGDWLCFCDHDDMYEDNALAEIEHYIQENNPPFAICGNMRSWNEEKNEFVNFIHKQAQLHGKFYNIKHLIKPYDIHFYRDIKTHEDIGQNCQCQAVLYELNTDFNYVDIMVYRQVEEPTSITRRETNTRGYLHEYIHEYIKAASEPFMKLAKTGNQFFVNQVIMTLLHAYFYYMGAIYREGTEKYEDNLQVIKDFYKRIIEELEMTAQDIIIFVDQDARKYQIVRNDCMLHEGAFIEVISFADFVFFLDKEVFQSCAVKEEERDK